MKRSTKTATLLSVLLALLASAPGCAPVAPGSDPVVVNLERSTAIAHESVEAFLQFDNDNRELLSRKIPAVHAIAERFRKVDADGKSEVQEAFRAVRAATNLYKSTRTAGASADAEAKLKAVQEFARQAREALVKAQSAKGAE